MDREFHSGVGASRQRLEAVVWARALSCRFAIWRFGVALILACVLILALPGEPPGVALRHTDRGVAALVFVGDVMLGRGVAQVLDGDWEASFAAVRSWLGEADVAFANLESPLTVSPQLSDGYDLRAPPSAVIALRAAGFDVVSLANNHTLDAGEAGLRETMDTLHMAGLGSLVDWRLKSSRPDAGSWTYKSAASISQIFSFLAFDDSVASLDLAMAGEAVTLAAEQADLVIVSVHWGGEYQASPSRRQRAIARTLTDAGAGLIIGHGPHVVQRVEWIEETLVAYSLGNFLFDQLYPADCRWAAILRVTVQGDRVVAVEALPTVVRQGRVSPAGAAAAAFVRARLNLEPEN